MNLLRKIVDKILTLYSFSVENCVKLNSPMDIAVPPMEISFLNFELSAELNELCQSNHSYNIHQDEGV